MVDILQYGRPTMFPCRCTAVDGYCQGEWSIHNVSLVYLEKRPSIFLKPFKWFAEFFLGQLPDPRAFEFSSARRVRFVRGTDKVFVQSKPGKIYEFPL